MSMTNENPHIGDEVLGFLNETLNESDETHREGKKEAVRLALTDAMRRVRKRAGLTQTDLANRLDVSQSWVSKLESANYDHQVESIVAYLDALEADLKLSICTPKGTVDVNPKQFLETESAESTRA